MLLNTGVAAGSCSLWVLAPRELTPRELSFALSEIFHQRFLLALGYETQPCGNTEQNVGGKPIFKCGVLTSKAGVWESSP